jgi:hypothetical protein
LFEFSDCKIPLIFQLQSVSLCQLSAGEGSVRRVLRSNREGNQKLLKTFPQLLTAVAIGFTMGRERSVAHELYKAKPSAEKSDLDVNPVLGEEAEKIIAGVFKLDPSLVRKLKDILYS